MFEFSAAAPHFIPFGATAINLDIEDPEALRTYLMAHALIRRDELPTMRVLGGGVSSRVVHLERPDGQAWVLKQALPKLRVEVDWFSNPDRVHREGVALRWLYGAGISVPKFRYEDHDTHLLVMDAVQNPHENWKSVLLAGKLNMRYVSAFAQLLADIHLKSSASRREVEAKFDDRTYFESLRIEPYYLYTASHVDAARAFMSDLVQSTRANRHCLVHGDFSPKNVLIHEHRLVLLDHEVAHFGDPAFDIGFSMTHLLSKAHHLPAHRRHYEQGAIRYWSVYWKRVGTQAWAAALEARAVNSTLACLLARVEGRSRLEYLDGGERSRQRDVVLQLMRVPPSSMRELVTSFVSNL